MQALTAQGASCQNYILVRGLLALPPCAFIEDDARGLLLLVGGASVGLQEASAWKSPMRFTAAAGGLAAQKVAPGMSPRYPTSAARLPECAVGPGELVQTGLFACLASGYLRILMQLLLGIKIAEPRLLLLGVFVVINDLKMSNQI